MNSAAEQILGCREKDVRGIVAEKIFPKPHPLAKQFVDVQEIKTEIAMTAGGPYYELQIMPLQSHHGVLAGRLCMFYDITERKQVEQQRLELTVERERVRLLQQFISHMSHDLRTPLTSLKLTQYLLRKDLAGQHSDRLDSLEGQTRRLTEMVESMLTLLRLEGNGLENLFDVDVNDILRCVIEANQLLATKNGAQLQFNPNEDLPHILANKDELILAFSNMVVNAIHYTPGGEISISTVQENDRIGVRVRDRGIGISAEDLPHIFERFYRADGARGTQNGGLGLGLTITKTIIDRHSGTIDVESQLGQGSEFSVWLPLVHAG